MTNQRQKDAAAKLAEELTAELKPFGVTEAKVDDWSDYGDFSVLVFLDVQASHTRNGAFRPKNDKAFNMRAIMAKLVNVVKRHTSDYRYDKVQRLYTVSRYRGRVEARYFDGYERDYVYLSAGFGWMN